MQNVFSKLYFFSPQEIQIQIGVAKIALLLSDPVKYINGHKFKVIVKHFCSWKNTYIRAILTQFYWLSI